MDVGTVTAWIQIGLWLLAALLFFIRIAGKAFKGEKVIPRWL